MSETEWTNDAVITMVNEYEKREELWKKDHNLYRVQSAKATAWRSIARVLDCEVDDVRKKFNSIMASYRRERTKVREGGKSTWFLYPHMTFIAGYIKSPDDNEQEYIQDDVIQAGTEHYEQIETLENYNMDSDSTVASEPNVIEEPVMIKHEPQVQAYTHPRFIANTNSHGKRKLSRTLKKRPKRVIANANDMYSKVYVDNRIQEVQKMVNKDNVTKDNVKKDDCDTYGEYIASTLRKHNNKTRCLIKQAINNILFEQEMQKYENPLANDDDVMIT